MKKLKGLNGIKNMGLPNLINWVMKCLLKLVVSTWGEDQVRIIVRKILFSASKRIKPEYWTDMYDTWVGDNEDCGTKVDKLAHVLWVRFGVYFNPHAQWRTPFKRHPKDRCEITLLMSKIGIERVSKKDAVRLFSGLQALEKTGDIPHDMFSGLMDCYPNFDDISLEIQRSLENFDDAFARELGPEPLECEGKVLSQKDFQLYVQETFRLGILLEVYHRGAKLHLCTKDELVSYCDKLQERLAEVLGVDSPSV